MSGTPSSSDAIVFQATVKVAAAAAAMTRAATAAAATAAAASEMEVTVDWEMATEVINPLVLIDIKITFASLSGTAP